MEKGESSVAPDRFCVKSAREEDIIKHVDALPSKVTMKSFNNGKREEEILITQDSDKCAHTSRASSSIHEVRKFEWCDRVVYEGDFQQCRIKGTGKYTWADGSIYKGEVIDGLRHGLGTFICKNKTTVYTGQWRFGEKSGKGKMVYDINDQFCCYEGDWFDNMKSGYGKMHYSSGNIYEGQWKDNKQHGVGTMHWFARGEVYSGEWVNGHQHGNGTHLWTFKSSDSSQYPLRNWYEGDWTYGHKEGHGIFYYSSGCRYEGYWKEDKKHGLGCLTTKNGLKLQCYFIDDKIESNVEGSLKYNIMTGEDEKVDTNADFILTVEEFGEISSKDKIEKLETTHLGAILLRYISELRLTYVFYSSLGTTGYSKRVSVMNGLQFSAFLRDINVNLYGLTIFETECLLAGGDNTSFNLIHDPNRHILLSEFNKTIVQLACRKRSCDEQMQSIVMSILMTAKNVRGKLFSERSELVFEFLKFKDKLWKIYLKLSQVSGRNEIMYREIWSLFKEQASGNVISFYNNSLSMNINQDENASNILKKIVESDQCYLDLEVKVSFLELFEFVLHFLFLTVPLQPNCSIIAWNQNLEKLCEELLVTTNNYTVFS